jgi:hypothetical protein
MEQVIDEQEVRADVVRALRDLAKHGAHVRQLVEHVQIQLGLRSDALLSVLWYFMKAFYLPLDKVLPIREWLGTRDDSSIDSIILPAIERTRSKWEA